MSDRLHLTEDDMIDLLAGGTINAATTDGEEITTSADVPGLLHVAVLGNAFDGMVLYGPFGNPEEAVEYGEGTEYTVVALNSPQKPEPEPEVPSKDSTTITVTMAPRDQRFYQGVATGSEVHEAHRDVDFPDDETRTKLFYFYAGALAVDKHGCQTSEDFEPFLLGLATRAPQPAVTREEALAAHLPAYHPADSIDCRVAGKHLRNRNHEAHECPVNG